MKDMEIEFNPKDVMDAFRILNRIAADNRQPQFVRKGARRGRTLLARREWRRVVRGTRDLEGGRV